MLCVNKYPQAYIDECRSGMEAQLAAYCALAAAAKGKAAVETFAPLFFNSLVVVLEGCFVHRTRGIEGKDGNPLNEVRMLCNSILQHRGVLTADKSIKYSSAKSVTKLEIGAEIKLTEAEFIALLHAFFAEIGSKFV